LIKESRNNKKREKEEDCQEGRMKRKKAEKKKKRETERKEKSEQRSGIVSGKKWGEFGNNQSKIASEKVRAQPRKESVR
jgi:hypothetical protein